MFASCPSCPGFVPSEAQTCPHCGAQQDRRKSTEKIAALAAKVGGAAAIMVTLMACYGAPGGFDDDFTECVTDADCGGEGFVCDDFGFCVTGEICSNGFDDDGDGLIDGDDEDCSDLDFETNCEDGFDDDEDGTVDCADFDCNGAATCLEDCANGVDDDEDGFVDCTDIDSCAACPLTEIECGNLFDDDQDGQVDCDDDDCDAFCTPPTCGDGLVGNGEECDDGNVIAGDGCSDVCLVELEVFCENVPVLALGETQGSNVGTTNVFSGTCVEAGGQEVVYAFTAVADGTLFLSLQADQDMAIHVRDACTARAAELACANAVTGGQLESTSTLMTAGQTVFVVADGVGLGSGGPFVLTTTFVEP